MLIIRLGVVPGSARQEQHGRGLELLTEVAEHCRGDVLVVRQKAAKAAGSAKLHREAAEVVAAALLQDERDVAFRKRPVERQLFS